MGSKTRIIKTKGIRAPDIILAFLRSENVHEPQNFLTQICYETSAFLPFYFLLVQGRLSLADATKIVTSEPSTQPAKTKFLQRIVEDSSLSVPLPCAANAAGQRKLRARELLLRKQIPSDPDAQCLKDMLAMIRTLQELEVEAEFVKAQLEKWFNGHYAHGASDVNHEIRRAVCYVDFVLNRLILPASVT